MKPYIYYRILNISVFRILLVLLLCSIMVQEELHAQYGDTGYHREDSTYKRLNELATGIKQKNDAFNFFINYSGCMYEGEEEGEWRSGFQNKELRLEIKGEFLNKLFYRLRYRLNRSHVASSEDNFAKSTDYMMIGYRFNEHWTVTAGKMCQYWGGYEFDANPMYVYRYSDMMDNINSSMMGVAALYNVNDNQQFTAEISASRNDRFAEQYPGIIEQGYTDTQHPLAYIIGWNGSFFDQKLQTRWSAGIRQLAKGAISRQIILGQRLQLPNFQCYLDYSMEHDDFDRMNLISRDAAIYLPARHTYFEDVLYHSFVLKADWQFRAKWNIYAKGMYETASVKRHELLSNYRKHYTFLGGIEYYPVQSQDFRVSLSYIGDQMDYTQQSGLNDRFNNRIELGFMYRIRCF